MGVFILCLIILLSTAAQANNKRMSETVNDEHPLEGSLVLERMKRFDSEGNNLYSNFVEQGLNKRVLRSTNPCATNADCLNGVCKYGQCASCALTQKLITFDDIPLVGIDESTIPANYQQLQWTNGHVVRAAAFPGTGYVTVLQSNPNVGFNGYRNPVEIIRDRGEPFTVNSLYIAAALEDTLTITFTGFFDGVQLHSTSRTITKANVLLVTLNWVNINRLRLVPSPDGYFGIDNMDVTLCDLVSPITPPSNQVQITFDDIPLVGMDESMIPANYRQLQWSNGHVVRSDAFPGSGYVTVRQSTPNVGFNGNKNPMEITRDDGKTFTLNSFYIAAAFENTVTMTFTGYLNNVETRSTTYIISKVNAVLVTLNWANIDKFRLSPTPAAYFGIDNVYVTLVNPTIAD